MCDQFARELGGSLEVALGRANIEDHVLVPSIQPRARSASVNTCQSSGEGSPKTPRWKTFDCAAAAIGHSHRPAEQSEQVAALHPNTSSVPAAILSYCFGRRSRCCHQAAQRRERPSKDKSGQERDVRHRFSLLIGPAWPGVLTGCECRNRASLVAALLAGHNDCTTRRACQTPRRRKHPKHLMTE